MSTLNQRLQGWAQITEYFRDGWVKGHMIQTPVVFELAFNNRVIGTNLALPHTPVLYCGIFTRRETLFEFQHGILCIKPKGDTFARYVGPLVNKLHGYRHHDALGALTIIERSR